MAGVPSWGYSELENNFRPLFGLISVLKWAQDVCICVRGSSCLSLLLSRVLGHFPSMKQAVWEQEGQVLFSTLCNPSRKKQQVRCACYSNCVGNRLGASPSGQWCPLAPLAILIHAGLQGDLQPKYVWGITGGQGTEQGTESPSSLLCVCAGVSHYQ